MKPQLSRLILVLSIALVGVLLTACGSTGGGGQQATDLASTQQSLESTQAALAALQAEPTEPEATAAPTEEPTVAPTPTQEPFFTEEFDGDLSNWDYFLTSGEDNDFEYYNEDGKLVFNIEGKDVYAYLTYEAQEYDDVRLDTRVRNLGSNNNNVTLICRESDRGWYEFNVANNGLYWIYIYDDAGDGYRLLYSGGSTAIKTGKDVNDYSIICDGNEFTLFINDQEVRTVSDNTLQSGTVGVSVSSFEFVPVLVEFEFLMISQP